MAISSKVSQAKSAISAITTDNLEDQKPKASSSVDAVGGIGRQIVGHAREAVGNDAVIASDINKSRSELTTLENTKDEFMSTLSALQRELQEAQTRFQDALTNAEQIFNTSFTAAQNELSGTVSSIETTSESNKNLHRQIQDLAS